jgi:hypothetical protein
MSQSSRDRKAYAKAYYVAHREELRAKAAIYNANHRKERAAYRATHREERVVYGKNYVAAHREERIAYLAVHREEIRIRQRMRRHGISKAMFDALSEKQGGVCAICGKADWNGKGPCLDHDHITGKLRGLLCRNCNLALGIIADDPKIAQAMVDYLKGGEI